MKKLLLVTGAIVLALQASSAMAFADDEARQAILELREQLKASQRAQIDLMTQVESMRAENQRMIGEMQELNRRYELLDKRLVEVEPTQVQLNGRMITVKPAERREFNEAVSHFTERDFKGCLTALNDFKKNWPKSSYLADADYWRASAYFALEDYKSTVAVTNNLYRVYPKSDKASEALLLKANAELSLGLIEEAKKSLNNLIRRYPKSEHVKTAKQRLAQIEKLG